MGGSRPVEVPKIDEVLDIVQNIQIIEGKLTSSPRAQAYVQDEDSLKVLKRLGRDKDSISFDDLMRILTRLLRYNYRFRDIVPDERVTEISAAYPIQYLLFDTCLAILDGDLTNARLFLAHAFNILRFDQSLNLILSVIINTPLVKDKYAREFVALLAFISMPVSAEANARLFGKDFLRRYNVYAKEMQSIARELKKSQESEIGKP